jgi:hypothetical protein
MSRPAATAARAGVAPLAALDRVEHVRLVDFGLVGGIVTENTDADPLQ